MGRVYGLPPKDPPRVGPGWYEGDEGWALLERTLRAQEGK
jgi:hypothetical protein